LQRDAGTLSGNAGRLLLCASAAATVLLLSDTVSAQEDPWFGPDKAKHFGASAAIAVGGYTLGATIFEERTSALALGGGLALSAGVGKELYDAAGHGTASERDLVWDVAGTVTGLGVAWLFDLLVRGDLDEAQEQPATPAAATTISGRGVVIRF